MTAAVSREGSEHAEVNHSATQAGCVSRRELVTEPQTPEQQECRGHRDPQLFIRAPWPSHLPRKKPMPRQGPRCRTAA